jgi:hypothetical protein
MATAGGDLELYIGSFANDAAANTYFSSRTFNQARGYIYWNSTDSELLMWDGSAWLTIGGGGGGGNDSLPDITNIVFVDKTAGAYAADGTIQFPYNSIQSAITAASSGDLVYVYPGTYTEQITMKAGVPVVGMNREDCIVTATSNPVVACGTVDAVMTSMTVTSATSGVVGVACTSPAGSVTFRDMAFLETGNFSAARVDITAGGAEFLFDDCFFDVVSNTTHRVLDTGNGSFIGTLECRNCIFKGVVDLGGGGTGAAQWQIFNSCHFGDSAGDAGIIQVAKASINVLVQDCRWSSNDGFACVRIFNDARVDILSSVLRGTDGGSSAAVLMNSNCTLKMLGNVCERISAAGTIFDVTATTTVTGAIIKGNTFEKGIEGTVQTLDPVKRVGGDVDYYANIAEAFIAAASAGDIVQLNEDVTISTPILPASTAITLDGQGFTLTRAAGQPAMTLGAGDVVTFKDIAIVGSIDINGSGAIAKFLENVILTGRVDIIAGDGTTGFFCKDSILTGDATELYCIRIADADPVVNIWNSYLQGDAGDPAIWMDTVTNDNIQVAFSTVLHGDGGANQAMQVSAAQQPDFNGHHNAWTEDTDTGAYNNRVAVAQRQDTIDSNVEFSWLK